MKFCKILYFFRLLCFILCYRLNNGHFYFNLLTNVLNRSKSELSRFFNTLLKYLTCAEVVGKSLELNPCICTISAFHVIKHFHWCLCMHDFSCAVKSLDFFWIFLNILLPGFQHEHLSCVYASKFKV